MKRLLVVPILLAAAVAYMLGDRDTGLRTLFGLRADHQASEERIRVLETRNEEMRMERKKKEQLRGLRDLRKMP